MITEQEQQLIQKYFFGTLTSEEHTQFVALAQQPYAQKEIHFQEEILAVIDQEMEHSLKKELVKEEQACIEKEKNTGSFIAAKRSARWKKWAIAASVTLVFSVIGIDYFNNNQDKQPIFQEYFKPYPNVVEPINRTGTQSPSLRHDAFLAYENRLYQEAYTQFQGLPQSQSDPSLLFYQAQTLLALQQYEEAQLILEKLISQDSDQLTQSQWYLALTYLQTDQTIQAIPLLKALENAPRPGFKQSEAAEILERLTY